MNESGCYNISMTKVLNFKVIVEQDEDGVFVALNSFCARLHDSSKTYEEVIKNINEALELVLEEAKNNRGYAGKLILLHNQRKPAS